MEAGFRVVKHAMFAVKRVGGMASLREKLLNASEENEAYTVDLVKKREESPVSKYISMQEFKKEDYLRFIKNHNSVVIEDTKISLRKTGGSRPSVLQGITFRREKRFGVSQTGGTGLHTSGTTGGTGSRIFLGT